MSSQVLLFGSSGFIGQNLSKYLNQAGLKVQGVSLRDTAVLESMTPTSETAYINLIGKAHDHGGKATEEDYFYANYELVKILFNHFMASASRLFVHISSLAAIAEFESDHPLVESDPCHPHSAYGRSKRAAEEWLLQQVLPPEKKIVIVRPPMVHGPGDKGNLQLLYKIVTKGIPYPLAAFDNQRSFIFIENFNFLMHQILYSHENLSTGLYHIADDMPISTKEIIAVIREITHKRSRDLTIPKSIIVLLAKIGDKLRLPLNTKRLTKMTSNLLVSNVKIKEALTIAALPVSAKEGLKQTIQSFSSIS